MSTWRPIRASCSSILVRNPLPTPEFPDSAPSQGRQELTSFAEIVHSGSTAVEVGVDAEVTTVSTEMKRPSTPSRTKCRDLVTGRAVPTLRRMNSPVGKAIWAWQLPEEYVLNLFTSKGFGGKHCAHEMAGGHVTEQASRRLSPRFPLLPGPVV